MRERSDALAQILHQVKASQGERAKRCISPDTILKIKRGKITWMQKEHFLMVKN